MDPESTPGKASFAFSRRLWLQGAVAGTAGWTASRLLGEPRAGEPILTGLPPYLTPPDRFKEFQRERPRITELSPAKLREAGLHRDTWQLEVVPDPDSNCRVERPLSRAAGNALDWSALMGLAETRAVRFLHVLACTNMGPPLGMGLWEGVPMRDVIWLTRPKANVRRLYYHGYHNDIAKQLFQSSLTFSRVLEDPPGELPVILCYKLNGQWLSPRAGGPVRVIVPGLYANKSVKWLQRVVLTNDYRANDTYATWNNDVESPLKTCARFLEVPKKARAGEPLPLLGLAQVGMSGIKRVEYSLHPQEVPLPEDDPWLERLDWKPARILPPPEDWGGGLPDGRLPAVPLQFHSSGRPRAWPLRYTTAYWTATLKNFRPGRYHLRCRTIDANGAAQPLPRPLPRTGSNSIQQVELGVEA